MGELTYLAVARLWSRLSRELKIHDNLLLFQHLLLLFNCVVTRTIQPAVVVSRVKIFIVEFSSWCPEKLSAIDLSNASLPNVLSHGVFWELFVIVVAEQVIIIQWTRIFVLAIIEVYPVLSADFLLYILIFIVVVLLLGIVGDDGTCDAARLVNVVFNWWSVDVCADRSC